MKLTFCVADPADATELAALHAAASDDLTRRYGKSFWSNPVRENGLLFAMRHSHVLIARQRKRIVGTLQLQTKKPWAIDVSYFTPVKKSLHLIGMAVLPKMQRKGIGRQLLNEAIERTRAFPADAIRLDAFDAAAGAGSFYAKCGFRDVGHVVYRNNPLIYFEFVLTQPSDK
jgi:GNAT superfamily N-acetyltransferase